MNLSRHESVCVFRINATYCTSCWYKLTRVQVDHGGLVRLEQERLIFHQERPLVSIVSGTMEPAQLNQLSGAESFLLHASHLKINSSVRSCLVCFT